MKLVAPIRGTHRWDPFQIVLALLVALAVVTTAAGTALPAVASISSANDSANHAAARDATERSIDSHSSPALDSTDEAPSTLSDGSESSHLQEVPRPGLNDLWLDVRQFDVIRRTV